jgi:hypothetical protein
MRSQNTRHLLSGPPTSYIGLPSPALVITVVACALPGFDSRCTVPPGTWAKLPGPLLRMPGKRAPMSAGEFAHDLAGSACGRARLFCAAPVVVTVLREAGG